MFSLAYTKQHMWQFSCLNEVIIYAQFDGIPLCLPICKHIQSIFKFGRNNSKGESRALKSAPGWERGQKQRKIQTEYHQCTVNTTFVSCYRARNLGGVVHLSDVLPLSFCNLEFI